MNKMFAVSFFTLAAFLLIQVADADTSPLMTPGLQWKGRIVVEFSETLGTIAVTEKAGIAEVGEVSLDLLAYQYRIYHIEKLFPQIEKPSNSHIRDISRYYILQFPIEIDIYEVAQAYQSNRFVITAESYQIHKTLFTPSDLYFSDQWALSQVNAETAWDYCRGSDEVIIGIVDTGIDTTHEDLTNNLWINPGEDLNQNGIIEPGEWNGIDDDLNGYIDDFWGWNFYDNLNLVQDLSTSSHGTACSGAASAVTDNNIGIASLGYQTKLMTAKVGDGTFIYNAMEGIQYCVANGVDVITMSFGGPMYLAYEQAVMTWAWQNGVILLAACGTNGGTIPVYPAAYDYVVGVGSTDSTDHLASFTNYGEWVELYAPGINLLLTTSGSDYEYLSGTSFSSPIVAGLVSLIWAADPNLANSDVLQQIINTAVNIDSLNPGYSGLLRIDAGAALSGLYMNLDLEPLNPPIIIPAGGGEFDYTIEISNQDSIEHIIDFWSEIVLPDNTHYGPILGPVTRHLSANGSVIRQLQQSIPAHAPAGEYLMVCHLGSYPTSICCRDTIPFVKLEIDEQVSSAVDSFNGVIDDGLVIPETFRAIVYPNPFNPTTTITFDLPVASEISFDVYDLTGSPVGISFASNRYNPGIHSISFDGSGLASGIYFYCLVAGEYFAAGKMVLMK